MIIVAANIIFASEADRDRAVELSKPIQQATRDEEPGCQAYCFAPDPCDPVAIQVYELWDDGTTLAAHFEHPNYLAMLEIFNEVGITGSTNRAYLSTRDESVYGPENEIKTTFFV